MTKSDLRKARKQARANGEPLTGELAIPTTQRGKRNVQAKRALARKKRLARKAKTVN